MSGTKKRILFLCTGNACRSQMAEGWLRHLAGDRCESLSAGSQPAGFVHPLAIAAMREVGIEISRQWSKSIQDFIPPDGRPPDLLISVCSSAAQECPVFPGNLPHIRWAFDDPAFAVGDLDARMSEFRRVRDEIRSAIEAFLESATTDEPADAAT